MMGLDKKVFKSELKKAPKLGSYPLSYQQRTIWLDSQLYPNSSKWNLLNKKIINGTFDTDFLDTAVNKLIERHASLRTVFKYLNGEPEQFILDLWNFKIDLKDFTLILNKEEQKNLIQECIYEYKFKPFDLCIFPLFRIVVIKLSNLKYIYLLVIHHILVDAFSSRIFSEELDYFYKGIKNKNIKELPPLRLQYFDYAYWQQKAYSKDFLERRKIYWHKLLSKDKLPVTIKLPVDYKKSKVHSFNGSSIEMFLENGLAEKLIAFSVRNRVQLFTTLLSAFSILLHKYSQQDSFIIGSSISGRDKYSETSKIIGYFLNTVIYGFTINPEDPWGKYLKEVQEQVQLAYKNQECSFDLIIQNIRNTKKNIDNQVFNVFIEYIPVTNYILSPKERTSLGFKESDIVIDSDTHMSLYDMHFYIYQNDNHLSFKYVYPKDLFNTNTIYRMMKHYETLLCSFVEQSNVHLNISSLEILNRNERNELLNGFNATSCEYENEKTIHQIFEEQVTANAESTALIIGGKKITYNEVNKRSNQLAAFLRKKSVTRDTIVGIKVERSLEMIIGIMAILKAGGAYLPIDPKFPEDRIKFIIEDSSTKLLLTDKGEISNYDENCEIINIQNYAIYKQENKCNLININTSKDLAYVIYTSGSTGHPKGVMIEHRSLINRMIWMQKKYPLSKGDIILQKTNYTFDVSVWELFWWFISGSTLCLLEPNGEKDPKIIVDTIEKEGITIMHFVPSMLNIFLEYLNNEEEIKKLKSLKQIFSSGESLNTNHVEKFKKVLFNNNKTKLSNLYGPTEATIDVSYYNIDFSNIPFQTIPIGKPIDNLKIYIINEDNQLQPIGIPGELCISGDGLARGYVNRAELTAKSFIVNSLIPSERMYKTGDIAKWLPDGNIEYIGRKDFQIKIRGFRVELGEIENNLQSYSGIHQSVVIAKEINNENVICAYYTSNKGVDLNEIRNYLKKFLPDYMIPSYFVHIDKMPLTTSGKIDKMLLPTPIFDVQDNYTGSDNDIQVILISIWSEVLKINMGKISINSNFFEIGGNSLKLIQVSIKIRERLEVDLTLISLFDNPTIKLLDSYIRERKNQNALNEPFTLNNNMINNQIIRTKNFQKKRRKSK